MKRLSIKFRVTLWFAALMVLLVIVALAFLLLAGKRAIADQSQEKLITAVLSAEDDIDYDADEGYKVRNVSSFSNGVYLSVYSNTGKVLYGKIPRRFDVETPFVESQIREIGTETGVWYVYDSMYIGEGEGGVWVRGIMAADDSGFVLDELVKLALIALPLIVVLAIINGYALINRAFLPVRQITQAAERINDGNDLSKRIDLAEGRDEIYTLGATFDSMFDRLQRSFEREKQFTSDASHELRTPTAVIIAQCEYALSNMDLDDEAREAFGTILGQAQGMSALVSQLLMLSRADRGNVQLQREHVNMSELSEIILDQLGEKAGERSISISMDIEPMLIIDGDETLLVRFLLNLIENGIKYGKHGGKLHMRLYGDGEYIMGEIADDGIGIAEEHIEKIWERFYQVEPSKNSAGGVGLGLPMVRFIAEAHGGSVAVKSKPHEGTVFTFTLPRLKEREL